jgi:zinc ribbon protein
MRNCPRCGAGVADGASTCMGCGADLRVGAVTAGPVRVAGADTSLVGQTLSGYLIEGEVARGGMGAVYRARRGTRARSGVEGNCAGVARTPRIHYQARIRMQPHGASPNSEPEAPAIPTNGDTYPQTANIFR